MPGSKTFAILVLALIAAGPRIVADAMPGPVEARIRELEEQWRVAQRKNDATAFMTLLAPDVTFIGTSGSLRDRANYMASRGSSWIPRAETFEFRELEVRSFGSVAIVTGRGETTGQGVAAQIRFTDVWAERRGVWQLVATQRTDIAR
jgi:uncharacterized protein (TIGR02246 family)